MRGPVDERILKRKARANALLGALSFAIVSAANLGGLSRAKGEFKNAANLRRSVG